MNTLNATLLSERHPEMHDSLVLEQRFLVTVLTLDDWPAIIFIFEIVCSSPPHRRYGIRTALPVRRAHELTSSPDCG